MKDFSAQLTREKFLFHTKEEDTADIESLQKAMGNRLEISLYSREGGKKQRYIIRAQNMHICLRIGAHVAYHIYKFGSLTSQGGKQFDWPFIFDALTEVYEKKWNPYIWAAIYCNGKCLFKSGKQDQSLLEIVEKCMAYHDDIPYSSVVHAVEDMFRKAGTPVEIDYSGEPVINLSGTKQRARINLLKRAPTDKEVIKIEIKTKRRRNIGLASCLGASAAILEAFQLGFFAARVNEQVTHKKKNFNDKEVLQGDHAARRIANMKNVLRDFESEYLVNYSPRAPCFEGFSGEVSAFFDSFYQQERKKRADSETLDELPPDLR